MIYSTTPSIRGKKTLHYHGLVTGVAFLGDSRTGDVINGNEKIMQAARDNAMKSISLQAEGLGANAILGIAIEHSGVRHHLMISVSGTAVTIE